MIPITTQELIENSMIEIGALAIGESATPAELSFALKQFQRIADLWQAQKKYIYTVNFYADLLLVPNEISRTIGPTGDYFFEQRPVEIQAANVILNDVTPNVRVPISIRGDNWYASNTVRDITAQFPTDLYYSPDVPNGVLYFWPVPTVAYGLELWLRVLLQQPATIATVVMLPVGYQEAMTLTLGEAMAGPFGRQLDASFMKRLQEAKAAITALNAPAQPFQTNDGGMPDGGRVRPYFNYRTGDLA